MKKIKKIISLLLVVVLMVFMCPPVAAQADVSDEETVTSFYAPAVRQMIEANLETGNTDEEFFHLLANAYLADPALLVETISDLTVDEISFLAKAIAYDLQKTDRVQLACMPDECETTAAETFARLICSEVANSQNTSLLSLSGLTETTVTPGVELLVEEDLTITIPTCSANDTMVFTNVTVSFTFSTNTVSNSARSYAVTLYKTKDGVTSTVKMGLYTIQAGDLSTPVSMSVAFNATGEYTLYANVKEVGSSVAISSYSSATITVRGQWHITVELLADRKQLGEITLYDASGTQLLSDICLGKSESGASMYVWRGNTPTGEYTGKLETHNGDTSSYGPYEVVKLTGQSGAIVESGRSGIWIHGGDPNPYPSSSHYPLRVTYGCVRVTNATQLELQNKITDLTENLKHLETGTVSITEIEDTED